MDTQNLLGVPVPYCFANFGVTKPWPDDCEVNGGFTIYFDPGNVDDTGLFVQTMLSEGKIKTSYM